MKMSLPGICSVFAPEFGNKTIAQKKKSVVNTMLQNITLIGNIMLFEWIMIRSKFSAISEFFPVKGYKILVEKLINTLLWSTV